jgi:predicted MFS family arabinose efflux permease
MAPYFYVYLQVTSQLSISNATYIVLAIPLVNSFAQLCYGSLISWMQRPKWLFVTASGLLVLGFGLQYAFYDPYSQMTGLVLSQIVAGFGAGGHLNAIVIAQASTSPEGEETVP